MIRSLLRLSVLLVSGSLFAAEPFLIRVIDADTQRGVPLVELKTTHNVRYFTDNAGMVAIDDLALLNQEVFFFVASHGYEFPADGFGSRGARLHVEPGKTGQIKIQRLNIAERMYRITGASLYDHARRAGQKPPLDEPTLNAQVVGCDSVQTAMYGGKLFWIWGDTSRLKYPLGNFHSSAATSFLPADGGLDPAVGVNLKIFKDDDGFAREMARLPGSGPTWLTALVSVKDKDGRERLVAAYNKIKPPLTVYESGLCEFDPQQERFRKLFAFAAPAADASPDQAAESAQLTPTGHAFRHEKEGQAWIYFGEALPHLRVADRYESLVDSSQYEAVKADVRFTDAASGKSVKQHHGCVAWSPYRKKWISTFTEESGGPSYLGEIWYAEADAPEGPWRKAVKIVTHDRYSFYNPKQHPYFSGDDGRYLYFEGTYTMMFSRREDPTPLYDYNQIMYRLDLTDERLNAARIGGF